MKHSRLFLATILFGLSSASHAQSFGPVDSLLELRGFRLGARCDDLAPAFDTLRRDGFQVPPQRFSCVYKASEFHTEYLLKSRDGRTELVELYFANDATLWKTRVSLTWAGGYRLQFTPTPGQLESSLLARFGPPTTRRDAEPDGASGQAHQQTYTWELPHLGARLLSGMNLSAWFLPRPGNLSATSATVRWGDSRPSVSLVVEMTRSDLVGPAERAEHDVAERRAAEAASRDARVLEGL